MKPGNRVAPSASMTSRPVTSPGSGSPGPHASIARPVVASHPSSCTPSAATTRTFLTSSPLTSTPQCQSQRRTFGTSLDSPAHAIRAALRSPDDVSLCDASRSGPSSNLTGSLRRGGLRGSLALGGRDARQEHFHQVVDSILVRSLRRSRRRLAGQKMKELLAVRVRMTRRRPRRRHRIDELPGGLDLPLGKREVGEAERQLLRASYLVAEEQRLESEGFIQRADRDEVRLGPKDEAADTHHAGGLHGPEQKDVGLLRSDATNEANEIALLVESRIDLAQLHEFLDLDPPAPFGGDGNEFGLGHRDEITAGELQPSHD